MENGITDFNFLDFVKTALNGIGNPTFADTVITILERFGVQPKETPS